MPKIEDGGGSARTAKVNGFNHLEVSTFNLERILTVETGKYWSISFNDVDPVGAADKFVYVKNTGTQDLFITDIRMWSTVAGEVKLEKVTGTPSYVGETAMGTVSRDLGSSITPTGVFNSDTDITGLTDAGTVMYIFLEANKWQQFKSSSGIFIPSGVAVALEWSTSTGILSGTLSIGSVNRGDFL